MGVVGPAVGPADVGVLHQDLALLLVFETGKGAVATQWIPDGPGPVGIEHGVARPANERFPQVRLVSQGVGPAEHRHVPAALQRVEGTAAQQVPDIRHEGVGVFGKEHHADSHGVVDVEVER